MHLKTLVDIVNTSLDTGVFPERLKTATVRPLIKKLSLDREQFQNSSPVSNLAYTGKLIEKVVANQLVNHMQMHNLDELYQLAYKAQHSTEMTLMKIHNNFGRALDQGNGVVVLLLDMSATLRAFVSKQVQGDVQWMHM